ncbi:MAG: hypothetical protein HW416_2941 [Chloroflexi bacterium]|nr:hypothetical protein [Chloroflexota bacterium]
MKLFLRLFQIGSLVLLAGDVASPVAAAQEEALATVVTGVINTIDPVAKTLNIKLATGTSVTLRVARRASITRNSVPTNLEGLVLRDNITAKYRAFNLSATVLDATGPAVQSVSGSVTDLNMSSGVLTVGSESVQTTANTKISRNGLVVSLSKITTHDTVVVHIATTSAVARSAATASSVVASGPVEDEVDGAISAIAGSNVTIAPTNGASPVTVVVTANTHIELDGQTVGLADLQVGMQVEAHYDPITFEAFVIDADSLGQADDAKIHGLVAAVGLDAGTLTITPDGGGANVTLIVNAATEIEVNGEDATLAEVQVGMPVRAEYDSSTLVAEEVKAGSGEDDDDNDGDAHVNGIVAAVTATSVTITPDGGGANITLTVDASTEIEVNDEDAALADIHVGDPIKAEYFISTLVAKELEVGNNSGDDNEVETTGTVAAVSSTTVTINPSNGSPPITLTVNSSTEIEVNGENATVSDIHVGDPIKAEYDALTLVASELKVGTNSGGQEAEVEGTVAALTDTTVTITPAGGGANITLTVNSSTEIKVDGDPGTIASIRVGDYVKAKYNTTTLVATKIEVED